MVPSFTGGLGGVAFFGAAAAATADGEGLGLATLADLCTLACGGVTAGGPTVQLLLEQK